MNVFYFTGPLLIVLGAVQLSLAGSMNRPKCVGPTMAQVDEIIAAQTKERDSLNRIIAIKEEMIQILQRQLPQSKPISELPHIEVPAIYPRKGEL